MDQMFILSVLAAILTLILRFNKIIEEKFGSKILYGFFVASFVVAIVYLWSSHTASKAEGIIKTEIDDLIRDNNSKLGALIANHENQQIDKLFTKIELSSELEAMEKFSKGRPEAWVAYSAWLLRQSNSSALILSASGNHNYNYRLILGYLWTNNVTKRYFDQENTFTVEGRWINFPDSQFLVKYGFPNPLAKYVIVTYKNEALGYAPSSAFARECYDKLLDNPDGWMNIENLNKSQATELFKSNFNSFIPFQFQLEQGSKTFDQLADIGNYCLNKNLNEIPVTMISEGDSTIRLIKLKDFVEIKGQ